MNKSELIDFIAKDAEITKKDAGKAVESFMKAVKGEMKKKDGKLTLVGFGTWSKVHKDARQGRNPRTQEVIKIPAKDAVKFKSSF